MCLGTSVALEVRSQDPVRTFRETAGPWDVEMAKVRVLVCCPLISVLL
jgi:hypothetical protein